MKIPLNPYRTEDNTKGSAGLLGLVIVTIVICFLGYFAFTRYFGTPEAQMDEPTKSIVQEAGIDTTSQLSVLESAKAKIKAAEEIEQQRADELLNAN